MASHYYEKNFRLNFIDCSDGCTYEGHFLDQRLNCGKIEQNYSRWRITA